MPDCAAGQRVVWGVLTESPLLSGLAATAVVLLVLFFVGLSIIAPHPVGQADHAHQRHRTDLPTDT